VCWRCSCCQCQQLHLLTLAETEAGGTPLVAQLITVQAVCVTVWACSEGNPVLPAAVVAVPVLLPPLPVCGRPCHC
jgi:hypothetical protein